MPGPDVAPPRAPPVPLVRTAGVRVAVGAFVGAVPCVRVAAQPCEPILGHDIHVAATCAPRRLVVTSLLGPSVTALEVQVAGGAIVRTRIRRLPARRAPRGRMAVAVLPADARPVAVVLRPGRSGAPVRRLLPLPPAARQCGYAGDADSGLS